MSALALVGGAALFWLLARSRKRSGPDTPKEDDVVVVTLGGLEWPDVPTENENDDPRLIILEMFKAMISEDPTPGSLYKIRTGDSLSKVVSRALGYPSASYQRAIAASPYNVIQYGAKRRQQQTTGYADIDGKKVTIGPAFLPRNPNVEDVILSTGVLKRSVSFNRKPSGKYNWLTDGKSYGVIFLPPLGPDDTPYVWPWDMPNGNPAPLLAAMGLDPVNLPKPWSQ